MYENQGDFEKAAEMSEKNLASGPADEKQRDFAYRAGRLYVQSGNRDKAIARFTANCSIYPEDPRNYVQLGRLFAESKDWKNAKRNIELALNFPQPAPLLKKNLSQTYAALNEQDSAARAYESYLGAVPTDNAASLELGRLLFALKRYEGAIEPLKRASRQYPKDFECFYLLGISYMNKGDFAAGRDALARAHALNRTHVSALERLAQCYRSLKEDDQLRSALKTWSALEPGQSGIRLELGALYLAKRKAGDAATVLAEAAQLLPLDARPHTLLAQCYERLGKDSLRLFHLKEANRCAAGDAATYRELGRYYLSKNMPSEAESALLRTVELDPRDHFSSFELGKLLIARNDFVAAYLALDAAMAAQPDNPLYSAAFGLAASLTGDTAHADPAIELALKTKPQTPQVLMLCGLARMHLDCRDRARQLLTDALARDHGLTPCDVALGDLCMHEARYSEAAACYSSAWGKGDRREETALKQGTALALNENYREAKYFFGTILAKNPGCDEARYRLVAAQCERGEVKKAGELAQDFRGGDALWTQLALATVSEHEGDLDAASHYYGEGLLLSPRNPLAHEGMARTFAARYRFDSAVCHYATARQSDSLNVKLVMAMGSAYEMLGRADSALLCYYFVNQNHPRRSDAVLGIARIHSEQHEFSTAIEILTEGLRVDRRNAQLLLMLGKQYELSENLPAAIETYNQAFSADPTQGLEALLLIGNIYYKKLSATKKAKAYFKHYVKAGGKDLQAMALTGWAG